MKKAFFSATANRKSYLLYNIPVTCVEGKIKGWNNQLQDCLIFIDEAVFKLPADSACFQVDCLSMITPSNMWIVKGNNIKAVKAMA